MITDTEKQLLLDFQRARYAYTLFSVDKARAVYLEARENLKKITDPEIAKLVRQIFDESASAILDAEAELYLSSWKYGDNTMMNGNEAVQ